MKKVDKLRKLQLTELEILKETVKICDKYNIKYFLLGGTLLGAVRHKGFIPWDDDIDIGMLREDYEKFIEVCTKKKVLGNKYFLQCIATDEDCIYGFAKVRKNNTTFAEENLENFETHKGIFVDIFPYDNAPSLGGFWQKKQAIVVKSIIDTIYVKNKIYKFKECRRKIFILFFSLFSLKKLKKIELKEAKNIIIKNVIMWFYFLVLADIGNL